MANETFQTAVGHHRAGRLREAELLYRQILEAQPRNVDALHMLGILASQVGRNDIAAEFLTQALTVMPASATMHAELGEFQRRLGNLTAAEENCRRAITLEPAFADGHFNLGVVLQEQKRFADAIASYRAALAIHRCNPAAHYNLGNALRDTAQFPEAIAAYRRALALKPDYAEAEGNLGLALHKTRDLDGAIGCFHRVLAANPTDIVALNSLGNVMRDKGDQPAAEKCYHRALEIKPDDAAAHTNLGKLLHDHEKFDDAAAHYLKAIAAAPERAEAYQNLGLAWEKLGRRDEAITMYREALARGVHSPVAQYYMAAMTGLDAPAATPADHIIESFDTLAETFDHHLVDKLKYRGPSLVYEAVKTATEKMTFNHIMDAGCGTGLCGVLFRPHTQKLSGIDLAPRMIDQSRRRQIYDELLNTDILETLSTRPEQYDLIIAADVLIYFGDLAPVFAAVTKSLTPGGLFVFTVEALPGEGHRLLMHRRYAHSAEYLRQTAAASGLQEVSMTSAPLRQENRKDVDALVVLLRRPL